MRSFSTCDVYEPLSSLGDNLNQIHRLRVCRNLWRISRWMHHYHLVLPPPRVGRSIGQGIGKQNLMIFDINIYLYIYVFINMNFSVHII